MDFGKLSDTFEGLAAHLDAGIEKGIGFAELGIRIESQGVAFAKMFQAMLTGMAGVLKASPVTLPGPRISPPA
jgi:hypothetical protein